MLLLLKTERDITILLLIIYEKIKNNNKLKKIDIKNGICHYFDNIIKINHIDLNNILLDEKLHENFLIYDVAWKTP